MKKRVNIFLWLLMIAVLVLIIVKINNMPSLSALFKPQKVTIENSPVVVRQIQALAQLVTISMYDEIVTDTSKPDIQHIQLPLLAGMQFYNKQDRLVVIAKVTVHIGIDMQQLHAEDISVTKDSLHLLLPPVKVLDAVINPSGVEVFMEEGDWNGESIARLKNKMQNIAIANAQSRGLFSQSQNKATQIFTDFFKAAGYKKIVIDFKVRPTPLP